MPLLGLAHVLVITEEKNAPVCGEATFFVPLEAVSGTAAVISETNTLITAMHLKVTGVNDKRSLVETASITIKHRKLFSLL